MLFSRRFHITVFIRIQAKHVKERSYSLVPLCSLLYWARYFTTHETFHEIKGITCLICSAHREFNSMPFKIFKNFASKRFLEFRRNLCDKPLNEIAYFRSHFSVQNVFVCVHISCEICSFHFNLMRCDWGRCKNGAYIYTLESYDTSV